MPSSSMKRHTSGATGDWGAVSGGSARVIVLACSLAGGSALWAQEAGPNRAAGASSTQQAADSLRFANGLMRQKKFELAAQEYQRVLNSGATGALRNDARFGLGGAWLSSGRFREARGAFGDFLKDAPDDPRSGSARFRVGELSYLLGDLPAARGRSRHSQKPGPITRRSSWPGPIWATRAWRSTIRRRRRLRLSVRWQPIPGGDLPIALVTAWPARWPPSASPAKPSACLISFSRKGRPNGLTAAGCKSV